MNTKSNTVCFESNKLRNDRENEKKSRIRDIKIDCVPFPQKLAQAKLEKKYEKFKLLKDNSLESSFLDIQAKAPTVPKMFEDLLSNKHGGTTTVLKLGDPSNLSTLVTIRGTLINKALCDLGAGVNLMPYSLFKKLENVGKLAPYETRLQLANCSLIYPKEILMDVSVDIGRSVVPCDFLIVDMLEDPKPPIFLGRPCLVTWRTVVNVARGRIVMEIGDEKHEFNIDIFLYFHVFVESMCHVDTPTKSSYELHVKALEAFLEGTKESEEVMSWKGVCDENFDLTHDLLQDDKFL